MLSSRSDTVGSQNGQEAAPLLDTVVVEIASGPIHVLPPGALRVAKSGARLDRFAPKGGLRAIGRDDVLRNADALTNSQIAELRTMAGQVGLGPDDLQFFRGGSNYSDLLDRVLIGPNVLPNAADAAVSRSILAGMSPRAVIAHERGHLLTSRAGNGLEGGSLLDEVQASLVARQLQGLNNVARYQLLRDAVERERSQGQRVRDLLPQLPYLAE